MKRIKHILATIITELILWFRKKGWITNEYIAYEYFQFRKKDFDVIDSKEIQVKKGKRKYTLVVIETKAGEVMFNLGRHHSPSNRDLLNGFVKHSNKLDESDLREVDRFLKKRVA